MKYLLIVVLLFGILPAASGQSLGLLKGNTMIVIDRDSNKPFHLLNLDTTAVKLLLTHREDSLMIVIFELFSDSLDANPRAGFTSDTSGLGFWNWEEDLSCTCNLDSLTLYMIQVISDSNDAVRAQLRAELSDTAAVLRAEIGAAAETTIRLTSTNVGIQYFTMLDDTGNEIPIQDSAAVLVRAAVIGRSMVKDSSASYIVSVTVRRIGGVLTIKDTTLEILHESDPGWDCRFSTFSPGVLRIQTKGDNIARFTADVVVTPVLNAGIDTTNHVLQPNAIADLNLWLDPDTTGAPGRIEYSNAEGRVQRWYSRDDSARVAVQLDTSLQYTHVFDASRGMWGITSITGIDDSMTIGRFALVDIFIVARVDSFHTSANVNVFGSWATATAGRGIWSTTASPAAFPLRMPGTDFSGSLINDTASTAPMLYSASVWYFSIKSIQQIIQWTITNSAGLTRFPGVIYEIIAYSRSLSDYERKGVYHYLKAKHNL